MYAWDSDFKLGLGLVLHSVHVGWLSRIFFNGCFLRGNYEISENFERGNTGLIVIINFLNFDLTFLYFNLETQIMY